MNMNRKAYYANHKEKLNIIFMAAALALVPIICAVVRCAIDGHTIFEVYMPASPWNDELFYYKLTDGVVNFGFPQGYFGFNESHGLELSFAAWSPVLLLFWVIWGFIFGWNLVSPVLCNIVIMVLTMLLFGLLNKPSKRQMAFAVVLFAAFTPVTRYMLSCMPEIQCFALLIMFFVVAMHYDLKSSDLKKSHLAWEIAVLFVIAVLLTWMRPYFILLFLTPAYYWIRRKGMLTLLCTGAVFIFTGGVYYAINHYLSAPYLTDLFYTDWLTAYIDKGLIGGVKYTLWKLAASGLSVLGMIKEAVFGAGLASGALYLSYIVIMVIFAWHVICGISNIIKNSNRSARNKLLASNISDSGMPHLFLQFQMLVCMLGFFVADLLMYRLTEGSKHTATFIIAAVFLLAMIDYHEKIRTGILLVLFLYLFAAKAQIPYDYAVPYGTQEHIQDLEYLQKQLNENMVLSEDPEDVPGYDNTVIWSLWDQKNGETVTTDFGAYYMIPAGFGINLCDGGYMAAQLENLQSRYIATTPGGDIALRCEALGGVKVGECTRLVVYDMREGE